MRRPNAWRCGIERLEARVLLSGWTTVDDFKSLSNSGAYGLAVDAGGQIYAAGGASDSTQVVGVVRRSADAGASWSTLPVTSATGYRTVVATTFGVGTTLFAAGSSASSPTSNFSWVIRRSNDGGVTWSTVDQLSIGGVGDGVYAMTADAAGNLYAVGSVTPSGTNSYTWLVRRSQDGGDTWDTVDSVPGTSFRSASAYGVFVHPTAGVFVAGSAPGGGKKGDLARWVVRRSQDGGNTWATVDAYQLNIAYGSGAHTLGVDAAGNLYAVGSAADKVQSPISKPNWIVRKSSNGGSTWTTVDQFPASGATGFAKDSFGNLYVIGAGNGHWFVRSNPLGQGAWSTVDDFRLDTGQGHPSEPAGIVADAAGHVLVAGSGEAADGSSHWIVRRFSNLTSGSAAATTAQAPLATVTTTFADYGTIEDPMPELFSRDRILV